MKVIKKPFTMPPPCVVIDKEELMKQYIRGRTEFLPLILRLKLNIDSAPLNLLDQDSNTTNNLTEQSKNQQEQKTYKQTKQNENEMKNTLEYDENETKLYEKIEINQNNEREKRKRRISIIIPEEQEDQEDKINEKEPDFLFEPQEPNLPPLHTKQFVYQRRYAPKTASFSKRSPYPSKSDPLFSLPSLEPEPIPPLKIIRGNEKQRLHTAKLQFPFSARPSFKWSFQPQRIQQRVVCPLEYFKTRTYRICPTATMSFADSDNESSAFISESGRKPDCRPWNPTSLIIAPSFNTDVILPL